MRTVRKEGHQDAHDGGGWGRPRRGGRGNIYEQVRTGSVYATEAHTRSAHERGAQSLHEGSARRGSRATVRTTWESRGEVSGACRHGLRIITSAQLCTALKAAQGVGPGPERTSSRLHLPSSRTMSAIRTPTSSAQSRDETAPQRGRPELPKRRAPHRVQGSTPRSVATNPLVINDSLDSHSDPRGSRPRSVTSPASTPLPVGRREDLLPLAPNPDDRPAVVSTPLPAIAIRLRSTRIDPPGPPPGARKTRSPHPPAARRPDPRPAPHRVRLRRPQARISWTWQPRSPRHPGGAPRARTCPAAYLCPTGGPRGSTHTLRTHLPNPHTPSFADTPRTHAHPAHTVARPAHL